MGKPELVVNNTGAMEARFAALKAQYFKNEPELCIERDVFYTESFKETAGENIEIRRAKAFKKVLENMPIVIQDHELVVGSPARKPRGTATYPELQIAWVAEELDTFETRPQDPFVVSDETKRTLREDIFPFWKGKSLYDMAVAQLPKSTLDVILDKGLVGHQVMTQMGMGHYSPSWDWLISKGMEGVIADAEAKIKTLDPTVYANLDGIDFLRAIVIACEGLITYGKRHAEKARELAAQEKNAQRKQELEKIAAVCDRVPAKPARTFHEAIQFFYFIPVVNYLETKAFACSPGRFDQYMYPYYKADIEKGILTREEALELMGCTWVKLSEITYLSSNIGAKYYSGYPPFQVMSIGGLDAAGNDVVNEVSYLCLEATEKVHLVQPSLVAYFSGKSPREFRRSALRCASTGGGNPAICRTENGMPWLKRWRGYSEEDARCIAGFGCIHALAPGIDASGDTGLHNVPMSLEFALNNGVMRLTGEQLGLPTGDARKFSSYEEVVDAFKKQLAYITRHHVIMNVYLRRLHEEEFPTHLESIIVEGCVDKVMRAKSPKGWATRYVPYQVIVGMGLADIADSLAVIKKLVFEEKLITMPELIDALEVNFEGKEALRQMLINRAPKFGNDDDYVDSIAADIKNFWAVEISQYCREANGISRLTDNWNSTAANVPFGVVTGALPSGRKAGEPLSDNTSPAHGYGEASGPTAVLKSEAKLKAEDQGTNLLNLRFDPTSVTTDEGLEKFVDLVDTYHDLGGYHVQFNVVSEETLKDAQKNPEKHQGLMVRVAGYSAYFAELCPEEQNDIIARAAHKM